ncbi:3-deoxy-D-manno-octulosonic acid transferase [Pseudoflavitalea sp. X16]|uniref:3-deoxy-D-manno-octulosonic acid transferase n=1 Tax=Paraflavitalea devenefica TaxID=2716334 RepID=UPI00141E8726|nr:glycosyltransferase N-terminal domain-containing protein [Paraflavitalea devenefica]NII27475.1 3-deoxy-D-manno-octulosonic acid transferase [Paraflavitalea devenefica]
MHLFFYTIFCRFYLLGVRLAALWNPKARLWLEGRKGLLERIQSAIGSNESGEKSREPGVESWESGVKSPDSELKTPDSRLIWMHCASLGEFEQGRPVLEALRSRYPGIKILLTFFSPSGYEVRKNYEGADYVFYLPMDSRANARRFLDMVQPSLVIWIKYEYWYHYLTALKKRKIPTLLVSGIFRPDQPFFKWYGRLHRYILESFTHLFVQTPDSRDLLTGIGFTANVTINGDTRFDRVTQIAQQFAPIPAVEAFCDNHSTVVAGSTWSEDEEELDHYANTHPEMRFIIAPHEVNEAHLVEIEKLFKHTVRYSVLQKRVPGTVSRDQQVTNTLIIDNIGMLSRLYKYATITYVGGGFGSDGVHNVLEAAVYSKPVVHGPVYEKYVEATELVEQGGAFPIETALELEKVLNNLLADTAAYNKACRQAGDYVHAKAGATDAVLQFIQEKRLLTN